MPAKKIVAVMGAKQSGKGLVGEMIADWGQKHLGFSSTFISFADPIREMMLAINPIVSPDFTIDPTNEVVLTSDRYSDIVSRVGYEAAKSVPEVRRLLQVLGTEAGRDILGEDVWVDHLISKCGVADTDLVLISDLRFINEYNALKSFTHRQSDTLVIRVARDSVEEQDSHASENEWRSIIPDVHVDNDAGISELREKIEKMCLSEIW